MDSHQPCDLGGPELIKWKTEGRTIVLIVTAGGIMAPRTDLPALCGQRHLAKVYQVKAHEMQRLSCIIQVDPVPQHIF